MGFNTQMVSFWLIWGAQILGNPHFQENFGAIQPGFGLHMAIQVEAV